MRMRVKKCLLMILTIAALILELLPNGVVLTFANPEGEPWRRAYSYFSLTPFGYASFGPFITAILTCVLLMLLVVFLFKPHRGLNTAILIVSGFAAAASVMPLMFGFDCITISGIIVTVLLTGIFGVCLIKE